MPTANAIARAPYTGTHQPVVCVITLIYVVGLFEEMGEKVDVQVNIRTWGPSKLAVDRNQRKPLTVNF
jgi:hypothetical protein